MQLTGQVVLLPRTDGPYVRPTTLEAPSRPILTSRCAMLSTADHAPHSRSVAAVASPVSQHHQRDRRWLGIRSESDGLGLGASKKFEGSSEFVQLRYHMGPVLTANITVHPIWYGRQWSRAQKRIIRPSSAPSPLVLGRPPGGPPWRRGGARSGCTPTRRGPTSRPPWRWRGEERPAAVARRLPVPAGHPGRHPRRRDGEDPAPPREREGGLYLVLTSPDVAVEDFCGQVCGFHYFTFPSIVGYALPYAWAGNSAGRCPEVCAYPFAVPSYVPGARAERAPNGTSGWTAW
uniref:Protein EXORDIUM-like 3 n=1 Tax=Ananas comosus var. bracteatus TaxID=296719 RepID=A0A6V7NPQ5_ANACO|nr:unnamed protein product [Ananas comosus var. bracteatus]